MIVESSTLECLILDPTWYRSDVGSPGRGLPNILEKRTTDELERIGRTFCYQVYKRRFSLLSEKKDDSDSETDTDEDEYSLHDTTEDDSSEAESEYFEH